MGIQIYIKNVVLRFYSSRHCTVKVSVHQGQFTNLHLDMAVHYIGHVASHKLYYTYFQGRQHILVGTMVKNMQYEDIVKECQKVGNNLRPLTYLGERELMEIYEFITLYGWHGQPVWVFTDFRRHQVIIIQRILLKP